MLADFLRGAILPDVFDTHVVKFLSVADRVMVAYATAYNVRATTRILPVSAFVTSVSHARWAMERPVPPTKRAMCCMAAQYGTTEVMEWMYTNHWDVKHVNMYGRGAAEKGNLSVLKLLRDKGYTLTLETAKYAAIAGNIDVLAWIFSQDVDNSATLPPATQTTLAFAAGFGQLDTVKWLHAKGHDRGNASICAATKGHLDVLQWLRLTLILDDEPGCCDHAAAFGHFHILRWAREVGLQWTESTMCNLAAKGSVEMLKWAFENGCPMGEGYAVMAHLAMAGSIEGAEWALSLGYPWNDGAYTIAAMNGHLTFLKWAFANEYEWASGVTALRAAEAKHYDVLRWVITHGPPVDEEVSYALATAREWVELRWAVTNGCPMDPNAFRVMMYKRDCIDPEMFEWAKNAVADHALTGYNGL
jgi:hypothetical protein